MASLSIPVSISIDPSTRDQLDRIEASTKEIPKLMAAIDDLTAAVAALNTAVHTTAGSVTFMADYLVRWR